MCQSSLNFIQLSPKLIPCFWPIFADLRQMVIKTVQILRINYLLFVFCSIKGAVGSADLKISKSALLSLNHHNFSKTEPIYTK